MNKNYSKKIFNSEETFNVIENKVIKKTHNKLVRDKIPQILKEKNINYFIRKLNNKEYTQALKTKLQEEVNEFLEASNKEHQQEELADILEVIYSLAKNIGITLNELEKTRQEKLEKRSGFEEKIYLEKTIQK